MQVLLEATGAIGLALLLELLHLDKVDRAQRLLVVIEDLFKLVLIQNSNDRVVLAGETHLGRGIGNIGVRDAQVVSDLARQDHHQRVARRKPASRRKRLSRSGYLGFVGGESYSTLGTKLTVCALEGSRRSAHRAASLRTSHVVPLSATSQTHRRAGDRPTCWREFQFGSRSRMPL